MTEFLTTRDLCTQEIKAYGLKTLCKLCVNLPLRYLITNKEVGCLALIRKLVVEHLLLSYLTALCREVKLFFIAFLSRCTERRTSASAVASGRCMSNGIFLKSETKHGSTRHLCPIYYSETVSA